MPSPLPLAIINIVPIITVIVINVLSLESHNYSRWHTKSLFDNIHSSAECEMAAFRLSSSNDRACRVSCDSTDNCWGVSMWNIAFMSFPPEGEIISIIIFDLPPFVSHSAASRSIIKSLEIPWTIIVRASIDPTIGWSVNDLVLMFNVKLISIR